MNPPVKNAYGWLINIDDEFIEHCRKVKPGAEHYVDIRICFGKERVEMTFEEFRKRIFEGAVIDTKERA